MNTLAPFLVLILPALSDGTQTPQAAPNSDSSAGTDYIVTGGVTNYWWIFLLTVILAVVVGIVTWFFSRCRRG
jgi:hypothetical protein